MDDAECDASLNALAESIMEGEDVYASGAVSPIEVDENDCLVTGVNHSGADSSGSDYPGSAGPLPLGAPDKAKPKNKAKGLAPWLGIGHKLKPILEKTCEEGWSAFKNCSCFAKQFHLLAKLDDIEVKTIMVSCPNEGSGGHAMNVVKDPQSGLWCSIEPQASYDDQEKYSVCVQDPNKEKCALVGKANGCDTGADGCNILMSDQPAFVTNDTSSCVKDKDKGQSCLACCDQAPVYSQCVASEQKYSGTDLKCKEWLALCKANCS